jgi:hypothetical protein
MGRLRFFARERVRFNVVFAAELFFLLGFLGGEAILSDGFEGCD